MNDVQRAEALIKRIEPVEQAHDDSFTKCQNSDLRAVITMLRLFVTRLDVTRSCVSE